MFPIPKAFIPYIAAFLLLATVYTIGHIKGSSGCEIKNAKKETAAVQKGVEAYDKTERAILSLPDSDLDKRLSHWLR